MFGLTLLLLGGKAASTPPSTPVPVITILADSTDIRLNTTCALQFNGLTLRDVFAELQQQTKVKIVVQSRWIGDLRATIYTQKVPLRVMLTRIANLYHLTWKITEEKPGESVYAFYESVQDRAYTQNLIDSGWKSVLKSIHMIQQYLMLPQALVSGKFKVCLGYLSG